MLNVLQGRSFAAVADFVSALNGERLANRDKWLVFQGRVEGREVSMKTYDTGYLQIFRIDGVEQAAPMDMKPVAWKEFIREAFVRQAAAA